MQSLLSTYHIVSWGEDGRQKPNTYLMGWSEVHRGAQLRLFIVQWGHCLPPLIPRLSFCMAWWNLMPSRLSCLGCESSLHPVYPVCVYHPPTASQWPSHLTNRLLLFHNIYTQVTPPKKIYLKFDELFLSGNLQILIFLDSSWLSVTKIVESELADKKRQVYFI